jgi:mannose-6-phosphate isomerase-like protein (cupin superfamily)
VKTLEFRPLVRFSSDKMQKHSVFSTDRVTTELYCFEPGQADRPRKYPDTDKIYFILEGTGRFTVGRTTREFRSGTAVLIPENEEHGVINLAEERLVLLVVTAHSPSPAPKS